LYIKNDKESESSSVSERYEMTLGQKIRELRQNRGMSQEQLAEISEIKQATVSRVETGQVRDVKGEVLYKLAKAIGVTVGYLAGEVHSMKETDIFRSNPDARFLIRQYEKFSAAGKRHLLEYARFLGRLEKKNIKGEKNIKVKIA
jgi:transcriptional regulator with XRE-family HTH domain